MDEFELIKKNFLRLAKDNKSEQTLQIKCLLNW